MAATAETFPRTKHTTRAPACPEAGEPAVRRWHQRHKCGWDKQGLAAVLLVVTPAGLALLDEGEVRKGEDPGSLPVSLKHLSLGT